MDVLFEAAGWFGAAAILVGYLSVSMGWLRPGRRFQVANLVGSAAFMVNGAFHGAWPSVVTNVVWFLISVVALTRSRLQRESSAGSVPDQNRPAQCLLAESNPSTPAPVAPRH